MKKNKSLTKASSDVLDISPDIARRKLAAIRQFQQVVQQSTIKGHDYGVIPGTDKPTLLKPGAEKIVKLLNLDDKYEIEAVEDWGRDEHGNITRRPFFNYRVDCHLYEISSECHVSQGVGSCNSLEGKYRWRDRRRACPKCGQETIIAGKPEYGGGFVCWKKRGGCGASFLETDEAITSQPVGKVENDDIYSIVNTLLKMAKKRALVDAALSVGRLSDLFTQDLEDVVESAPAEETSPEPSPGPEKAKAESPAPEPKPEPRRAPAPKDRPKKAAPAEELKQRPAPQPTAPRRPALDRAAALDAYEVLLGAMSEGVYFEAIRKAGYEIEDDIPDAELRNVYSQIITYARKLYGDEELKKRMEEAAQAIAVERAREKEEPPW